MYRRTSILEGIDAGALQTQLTALQQAYFLLMSGGKVAVASYTQGDGAKSVSYTQANIADLVQAIITVQTQIDVLAGGCRPNRRAPLAPYGGR